MSKIHVIIPVYNAKKFLREAVDSVLNQPYKGIDIVLVNDGSTDGSAQLCDEIAANEERVSVIHQENGGPAVARNTGMDRVLSQAADDHYIAFLDADDMWVTGAITEELIYQYSCYEIITFSHYFSNSNLTRFRKCENVMIGQHFEPYKISLWNIPDYIWCSLYSVNLIRYRKLRFPENAKCGEDICFARYAVYFANSAVGLKNCLVYYRHNEESIVHTFGKTIIAPHIQGIDALMSSLDTYEINDDTYKNAILDYCCWSLLEMVENYYKTLHWDNKAYITMENHALYNRLNTDDIKLSDREKQRISLMLEHKKLFKMKFLVMGLSKFVIQNLLKLPLLRKWNEVRRYPIGLEEIEC